jgi:hypothetical protein
LSYIREKETRKNEGRRRTNESTKDKEAPNESEERNDYPEVPPSAMSNYVCDKCGKPFQNQNDLIQHKRFEGS